MKSQRLLPAVGLLAAAALALTGCASNEASTGSSAPSTTVSGTITASGSSAQNAAQTAWIAGFQSANSKANITYNPVGSGAGRTAFESGSTAFAGSDAALTDAEIAGSFGSCTGKAIDLPVYISPIAVVYNVAGVKDLKLDAKTLAGIFSGQIKTWNDAQIKALNPSATLPSASITAVHRSDNSGTTANFTDYLAKAASTVWTQPSSGDFPASFGGSAANGTSGVIGVVSGNQNTIGYADDSQAGKLSVAKIQIGSSFVAPSADGAAKLVQESPLVTGRESNDIAVALDRTTTDTSTYPITLVSYAAACQTYKDANTGKVVKAYLSYITSKDGQQVAAKAAGSAPLTTALTTKVTKAISTIK